MKKLLLLLSFFLITPIFSFSQQRKIVNIDSIFTVYKNMPNTINKADELIRLYRKSATQRPINEAIIDEALIVSEELFYINGIAKCYNRKGLTKRYKSKYNESVRLHKRALSYFQKTTDSFSRLKCLNNIGVSYRKLNREHDAFTYYFKALKLAEQIDSKKSIAIANNGIGNIFVDLKEYDKALEHLKKGIAVKVEYNNERNQEIGLSNIGEVFILKKQYDSAHFYLKKALDISVETKNDEGVAIKNNLIGILNQQEKKYNQAIFFFNKSLPNLLKHGNKRYYSNSLINKGICLTAIGNYQQANDNINKGLIIAKNIESIKNIALAHEAQVIYFTKKNNFKKALEAYKKSTIFNDSILNIDSKRSIINAQIAYESVKKDKKIQQLANEKETHTKQTKKRFNNLLFGLLLSFFIIIGLLYLRQLNKKNTLLKLENKNKEIQNYILQINDLKHSSKTTEKDFEKYHLSNREKEIFNYISDGLTYSEIANKVFLSKNTVKTHIKNIYSKLDVKNRMQAINKIRK